MKAKDKLRNVWVEKISEKISEEDVMQTNSNEIAFPAIDEDGEEQWVVIIVKIPSGSRDGDLYDGYSLAEEYKIKCAEREEKAKASVKKKAEKIAKDKARREKMAEQKAKKGGE